jgi:oxygen-independent coproporphyrinogen-3 oxidase
MGDAEARGSAAEPTTEVRSLYVHAPFCARRCVYCDFAVTVSPSGDVHAWAEALRRELELVRAEGVFGLADRLETLYVGGGTPSLLGPGAMGGLRDLLGPDRLRGAPLEWTAEANPESFTRELAAAWREAGVNRVSLGVQSFDPAALRWMGRLHGPEGAEAAVSHARDAGFTNLSVDLIFGLPAHLARSWREDLERTLALDVPHVSLYGLGIEPTTPLGRAVAEGREAGVDEGRYAEEFLEAAELLRAAGYEHYEVSNFARPGHASRHNVACWEGRPYLGLGNGAHSYAPPVRRWNLRDWSEYAERLAAGSSPEASREIVDPEAADLERVWLALRTARGLSIEAFTPEELGRVERWRAAGWAELAADRVRLTPAGWLVLDGLAVDLATAAIASTAARSPSVGGAG